MYPVRGNKDPQVTVVPESFILPDPGSPFPKPQSRLQLFPHSFWSLLLPPHLSLTRHWLSPVCSCTMFW
ncbi:hypothetical protein DSO57_1032512 [Entomophthora muscae]|uniref:Uncharacterized protein n=1 Tax=Entomophthora muscae TaxID=34485 RepID=A0ACC2SDB3_9FUNG|nr:hypothetical protein DSO57_1032512 [Entomophthora muscae]